MSRKSRVAKFHWVIQRFSLQGGGEGCKYTYYDENPVRIPHFPIETGLATTGVDIMLHILRNIILVMFLKRSTKEQSLKFRSDPRHDSN